MVKVPEKATPFFEYAPAPESRAIVVHGAWDVSPKMVAQHGMLGRSEGCFAFVEADLPQVLARLGPGRLLLAGKY